MLEVSRAFNFINFEARKILLAFIVWGKTREMVIKRKYSVYSFFGIMYRIAF